MNDEKSEGLLAMADFAMNLTMNLTLKEYLMFSKIDYNKLEKIKEVMGNDLEDILSQPGAKENYNKNIKSLVGGFKKSKRKRKSRTSRRSKKRGGMRRTHSQADRQGFSNPTVPGWSIIQMFMSENTRMEYENLMQRRLQETSPEYYNRDVDLFRGNVLSPMILSLLGIIITYFFISYTVSNTPEASAERTMRYADADADESEAFPWRELFLGVARVINMHRAAHGDTTAQYYETLARIEERRRRRMGDN